MDFVFRSLFPDCLEENKLIKKFSCQRKAPISEPPVRWHTWWFMPEFTASFNPREPRSRFGPILCPVNHETVAFRNGLLFCR